MDFPVTVDSQEDFDDLIKPRLEREKTKRVDLQKQVDSLTAEKQELATKVTDFESRATAAEQWKNEREMADALNETRSAVAKEFGVAVEALRGADEAELRAHAEVLKPLIQTPKTPVIPRIGDKPEGHEDTAGHEAVRQLFGTD